MLILKSLFHCRISFRVYSSMFVQSVVLLYYYRVRCTLVLNKLVGSRQSAVMSETAKVRLIALRFMTAAR